MEQQERDRLPHERAPAHDDRIEPLDARPGRARELDRRARPPAQASITLTPAASAARAAVT
jgi:hypothetical protein